MRKDYDRSLELLCPVCASSQLSDPEDEAEPSTYICLSCGGSFTYEEIRKGNTERIEAAVEEMKSEVLKDIQADFKKMFKKFGK